MKDYNRLQNFRISVEDRYHEGQNLPCSIWVMFSDDSPQKHVANSLQLFSILKILIMILILTGLPQVKSTKIHQIDSQNNESYMYVDTMQTPILCSIAINKGQGTIRIKISAQIIQKIQLLHAKGISNEGYMLRIDYQPNRCIQFPQDILLGPIALVTIPLTITCSNLQSKRNYSSNQNLNGIQEQKIWQSNSKEYIKMVVTLRQAFILFEFPVAKLFLAAILPSIVGIVAIVSLWVIKKYFRQLQKHKLQ